MFDKESTGLSELQKSVFELVFSEIEREAPQLQQAMEASKDVEDEQEDDSVDGYCFELTSMVLALSGAVVGREFLANPQLLGVLLSLLPVGSPRIQRQILHIFRRILPQVSPSELDDVSKAACNLAATPVDFFLFCVAKAFTVQIRTKGVAGVAKAPPKEVSLMEAGDKMCSGDPPAGVIRDEIAKEILNLLSSLYIGDSEAEKGWRDAIESITTPAVSTFTEIQGGTPLPCEAVLNPRLWKTLSGLCLIASLGEEADNELIKKLGDLHQPQTQEVATVQCGWCESATAVVTCRGCAEVDAAAFPLCVDCDRVVHLNKRNKGHVRESLTKIEDEPVTVHSSDGAARLKTSHLVVVADIERWKAIVEFKVVSHSTIECRFCETPVTDANKAPPGLDIALEMCCSDPDCLDARAMSCTKMLPCNHPCGGVKDELICLPCLKCGLGEGEMELTQDYDDYCVVCYTYSISRQPAVRLQCGHVIHYECVRRMLEARWNGPVISFGFASCPMCRKEVSHPMLEDLMAPIIALKENVERKSLMRLQYDNLEKAPEIVEKGGRFFEDPVGFAMSRYAYYVCHKCEQPFFGGERVCAAARAGDFDASELICGGCLGTGDQYCSKHGGDFLEFKCRFCCSVAIWFCFGTTHFCDKCHDAHGQCVERKKEDMPMCGECTHIQPVFKEVEGSCPLKIAHPPTGEEFALGCGVCRNAQTF